MDLRLEAHSLHADLGIEIRLLRIPREIMEKNRTEVTFFEIATLETEPVYKTSKNGKSANIKLKKFLPSLAEVPEKELAALEERAIKHGFDFIDFWAVDSNASSPPQPLTSGSFAPLRPAASPISFECPSFSYPENAQNAQSLKRFRSNMSRIQKERRNHVRACESSVPTDRPYVQAGEFPAQPRRSFWKCTLPKMSAEAGKSFGMHCYEKCARKSFTIRRYKIIRVKVP
jgi:hypothetical protein